jgi:PPM family protein phosphatase
MRFAGCTHPGRRGGPNEDSIGWDATHGLCFVADGMGGHSSGDVASRLVKETLLATAATLPLEQAVMTAHRTVSAAAEANPVHANMGSTVVAAKIAHRKADVVWVGDSRAYLWRGGKLQQLTRDHSFLEILRDQDQLSETQMRGHPNKNIVTQTLGLGSPEPSVRRMSMAGGDWLLLCSDGLNDELEDSEIAEILAAHATPEQAAEALISAALGKGGRDNVSAVVVEYDGADGVSSLTEFMGKTRRWLPVVGGIAAALIAALVWWWMHGRND